VADASSVRILAPDVQEHARAVANELDGFEVAVAVRGRGPRRASLSPKILEKLLTAGALLERDATPSASVPQPPMAAMPAVTLSVLTAAFAKDLAQPVPAHASVTGGPGRVAVTRGRDVCVASVGSGPFVCSREPVAIGHALRDDAGRWIEARGNVLRRMGPGGRELARRELGRDASACVSTGRGAAWREGARVRAIAAKDDGFGSVTELGTLPGSAPLATACVSDRGSVVAMQQDDLTTLWFEVDGAWSTPVALPRAEASAPTGVRSVGHRTLRCEDGAASIAWAEATLAPGATADEHVVHLARCTKAGCTEEHASVGALSVPRMFFGMNTSDQPDGLLVATAAPVGDRVLLVWEAARGVWARQAALDRLASTPSTLVATRAGLGSLSLQASPDAVWTHGDAALFFVAGGGEPQGTEAPLLALVPVRVTPLGIGAEPLPLPAGTVGRPGH
jgi:hypothetical protein